MRKLLVLSTICLLFALPSPLQAQRIYWGSLPGTERIVPTSGFCWSSRQGRILTACLNQVIAVDPFSGHWKTLASVGWTRETYPAGGEPYAQGGPMVAHPVEDAAGFIYFGSDDHGEPSDTDSRIRRIDPRGGVEVIAGGGQGDRWSGEDVPDARTVRLSLPGGLALAADGRIFFREWMSAPDGEGGEVALGELTPHPERPGGTASRYSLRRIPMPKLGESKDGTPIEGPAEWAGCRAVATGPEGVVVTLDESGRVWRAVRRFQEGMEIWAWDSIAGDGQRQSCDTHGDRPDQDDARATFFCAEDEALAVGPGGRIYVANGCSLWELAPQDAPDGPARWRSRRITGRRDQERVGGPAIASCSSGVEAVATLPGGGLLVATNHWSGRGIQLIGPEGADTALGAALAKHRKALKEKRFWVAMAIMAEMGVKRDQAVRKDLAILDKQFKLVGRKPDLLLGGRSLPLDLRWMVNTFLVDPVDLAMRADRAMAAMAGDRQILCQILDQELLRQVPPPVPAAPDAVETREEAGDGQDVSSRKRQRISGTGWPGASGEDQDLETPRSGGPARDASAAPANR